MSNPITKEQLERLEAVLAARIQELEHYKGQLHLIDSDVLEAGLELLEDEDLLARWLIEPAASLGGEIPLRLMKAEEGRRLVATALRRIDRGVYS